MKMSTEVRLEPVKEVRTVGYRWSVQVTRKKYTPSPQAAYKGDTEEVTQSLSGNTLTMQEMYEQFNLARKNLGLMNAV